MTIVRGVRILAAPCCGARYASPRFVSMNFSAFEHWTDGWRDFSLMPIDTGLRRCQCGQLVILNRMVAVGADDRSDLPSLNCVPDEDLHECISQAANTEIEAAARRALWWYLNHEYRDRYRQHRDKEEATTRESWEATNPDNRNMLDKLLKRKPPVYSRPPSSSFTFPKFEPSTEQLGNMKRLSEILLDWNSTANAQFNLELAELLREQGRFEEAERAILAVHADQVSVTSKLISKLITENQSAPIRYRM